MVIGEGDYGVVKITGGQFKGKIVYYDDDAFVEKEYDDVEEDGYYAIVYFGNFFVSPTHCYIPHYFLEHVTINDLMSRKDELYRLCALFELRQSVQGDLTEYLSELHLVETYLLEKLVEQRYERKQTGSKIFISHSSFDKPFAKKLCMDLEANGFVPWLDEWEISVGESIPEKISSGLHDADFIIVILSENSVNSKWVEREWQIKYWSEIESGNVNVLPLLYQDCVIPDLLKTRKYADFRTDFNQGLHDLINALRYLSNKK
ncbi:TIR domain-containing protein [Kosakonia arachidis]|uniref:TIR domain-containing protein n=1 Tax=Kosakonia arachidis TaxID=551989 RepID=A0A1I7DHK4_9ENTR|nr:toll/interleukin-1 receptor domain-containing protein [Kosakonia arachidis]SFU11211.1 TIR domain-containing protein [Kosakonia arachidis]